MACDDADTATAALASALAGPRRVETDGVVVEQQSLKDLIEADRYFRSRCAATSGARRIRMVKFRPEGTV